MTTLINRNQFDLCFSGYFRDNLKKLHIPKGIIHFIFEYQKWVPGWDRERSSPALTFNGHIVTGAHHSKYQACFGIYDYDSVTALTAVWKIKIHKIGSYVKIGIIDLENVRPELNTFSNEKYGYGYNSSGQLRNDKNWKDYGHSFQIGDVITTILDMDSGTLSYKHLLAVHREEKDLGIAYNIEKNKTYRFVVESYGSGDRFEMLH